MPVQTRAQAAAATAQGTHPRDEPKQARANQPGAPLAREGTLMTVEPSATGLGTHTRWHRGDPFPNPGPTNDNTYRDPFKTPDLGRPLNSLLETPKARRARAAFPVLQYSDSVMQGRVLAEEFIESMTPYPIKLPAQTALKSPFEARNAVRQVLPEWSTQSLDSTVTIEWLPGAAANSANTRPLGLSDTVLENDEHLVHRRPPRRSRRFKKDSDTPRPGAESDAETEPASDIE